MLKISDEYNIIKKIGAGSFGEVYMVKNKNNEDRAIKVESIKSNPMIIEEYKIYKYFEKRKISNIPKYYNLYETPEYYIMEMELLDKNLDSLFKINHKFTISTVLKLAVSIINILSQIHSSCFLHRDIKPSNFMIKDNNIYIIDFGLAKKYKVNGEHIEYKTDRSLIGTARYASINVHNGIEPSRRDDLISLGYMLIYFINGSLPWQGIKTDGKKSHIVLIGQCKLSTSLNKLCSNIPKCIKDYLQYCMNLSFSDKPDYDYLFNLFGEYSVSNNIELKYEWE